MSNGIFFIDKDENLTEMKEQAYDSEDLLQELLAKYPNLLSGEQIDSENPRKWLLISREVPLPDSGDSSGRWAVDHLFLDQDAIPTIIEVKRSSDTRIRREIVGQMLDYAANAVIYWSIEKIQNLFEENCKKRNLNPENELQEFLDNNTSAEDFWVQVKTNLQAGKVRLIFVADLIPSELQRIVEFLNEQMDPAEVLAFEIKQYIGDGDTRTLIPRIMGQTAEAQKRKGKIKGKDWNRESFTTELELRFGEEIKNVALKILDWADKKVTKIWWGKGAIDGSFYPMFEIKGDFYWTISVWTYGKLDIQFNMMKLKKPPFNDVEKRKELLRKINEIEDIKIPEDSFNRYPSIPLEVFINEDVLSKFLNVLNWYLEEIKKYNS